MKFYQLLIQLVSVVWLLSACHYPSQEALPLAPPNQRPKAITIGQDSTHYIYDTKQRLVSKDLTQGPIPASGTYPMNRSEYTYLSTTLYERAAIGPQGTGRVTQYPLDQTGYHVLAYTQKSYSFLIFDSLRVNSPEGILTSALQFDANSFLLPQINRIMPNRNITVKAGDVMRAEFYVDFDSSLPYRVIDYSYDTDHYGPLATDTFLGETSLHALVSKTITTYQGNTSWVDRYTYSNTYDNRGRITSQLEWELPTASFPSGIKILTKFYY